MDEKVFDRIEKKYLLTNAEKRKILKIIRQNMKKDKYYRSKVMNLYFDTDNYDFIIQSMDQPVFKEKLRARSYGGYDRVFLEIKTKMRGKDELNAGYKRRVMITLNDFDEFVRKNFTMEQLARRAVETPHDIQIAREIDYFVSHFNLKPKILVMYDRESYKNEAGLRVTFDQGLRYRDTNLGFFEENHDKIYFKDKRNIIMEIKAPEVMPLWLVKALSENKVYPQRFSKVGNVYTKLRKEKNV